MFNTGDTVSYGTSGVCTIAEKKRLTLGGQPHECFILRPVFDASMKICVPCDSTPLLQKMRAMPTRDELLSLLDVLVDGRFVQAEHDISLRFRGSRNQRLLDVPKSLAAGQPVWWEDEKVFATHSMER